MSRESYINQSNHKKRTWNIRTPASFLPTRRIQQSLRHDFEDIVYAHSAFLITQNTSPVAPHEPQKSER